MWEMLWLGFMLYFFCLLDAASVKSRIVKPAEGYSTPYTSSKVTYSQKRSGVRLYADWGYTMDSEKPLQQQCRSTGYHKDSPWVVIKKRGNLIKEPRRYLKDLRTAMYDKADVEKCHQPEMTNVLEFLECQIRRHMRLELQIPKYPEVPL
ncbi:uncharacterized protein LOC108109178 [Drosophila eugracilis]|uniref:uncharacterized protein LOC108109178 n=1 Tax=Drosophila eugracilis TaxID=29029 RepID=UPI0007E7621C|nr:uncharacterized protein LOC108109178 [Drosophila eugracilis]